MSLPGDKKLTLLVLVELPQGEHFTTGETLLKRPVFSFYSINENRGSPTKAIRAWDHWAPAEPLTQ